MVSKKNKLRSSSIVENITLEGKEAEIIRLAIQKGHLKGVPCGNGMVELIATEGFRDFMKEHGFEF